jgi:phasin
MATPRKPKSSSAGAAPRLAKKMTAAPRTFLAQATQAAEPAMATAGEIPVALPPAIDVLIHETAEKAVSGAKDAQETLRCASEEALVQTRAAYDKMKHAAEDVTDTIEASYVNVTRGFGELNQKALEGLKAQADASLEHFKAMAAAKSLPEAISLQTDYARKQFEALSIQMKELAALAQKVVTEATEPLKTGFDKNLAA